ncbi:hypothetical protein M2158_008908 [Streptomyces sp. SAI-144]|uniref:hypothetical protein n=2 Tax=unclassified Streptomyces TaxID=2593676 RepID=UPI0024770CD5|nr:hypothetical protein [Streptomyces sp. SAI-144]MDH6440367.1 hypothetical protein [Streptomyces sp. SAI-144]
MPIGKVGMDFALWDDEPVTDRESDLLGTGRAAPSASPSSSSASTEGPGNSDRKGRGQGSTKGPK